MIDLKLLRTDAEGLRKAMAGRSGRYGPILEEALSKEGRFRDLQKEVEALRARRNEVSQKISKLNNPKATPEGTALLEEANRVKKESADKEAALAAGEAEIQLLLLSLPNPPQASVPLGKTPDDNKVAREDVSTKRTYDFKPLDHHELGERLGILDFQAGAKLSGARFTLLRGAGARLERALIQFMLDLHTKEHGYYEMIPPYLVTAQTMTGTGQLPKFEEDLFKTTGEKPLYLIPTAEVPLTNLHAGEILAEEKLPLKYCAHTPCFRQEAGTYGKDTRGLIRQHQFNKVELVWITKPEESLRALEQLTLDASEVLRRLGLPYRVLELCTGDLGFASSKTYDLEVWMAGEGRWREISSCSDCRDFQARRMKTRVKAEKGTELVHTLNGSGVAVGRAFAAILEHYQRKDGSIEVPQGLRPYFGADSIVPEPGFAKKA